MEDPDEKVVIINILYLVSWDSCGSRQLWRVKGSARPFESLHQVQIIPRGSCFFFLWGFCLYLSTRF